MESAAKDHILIVDDEPQVLVALEDLFADMFVVTKCASAHAALEVDQRMPRMTGDELLAKLGEACPASRILLTGYADL